MPGHQQSTALNGTPVNEVPLNSPMIPFVGGSYRTIVQERSLNGVDAPGTNSFRHSNRSGINDDSAEKPAEADAAGGRKRYRILNVPQHPVSSRGCRGIGAFPLR